MAEVFRYWINGVMNDNSIIAPRLATRPFIEAANGQIIKGSGRNVDDNLVVDGAQAIQGFTGEQIAYLRDLISLGSITITKPPGGPSTWLARMIVNRLVSATLTETGCVEYAITSLGRAAVKQLL